jgi:hypothetical protein
LKAMWNTWYIKNDKNQNSYLYEKNVYAETM